MKKPKICLLFAGGTIGMVTDKKDGSLKPASTALELVSDLPELKNLVTLHFENLFNMDSSNMQPHNWSLIAEKIKSLYDKFDGFVVAQGTDTMTFTASALSYALQNLGKPVVLTGSLIPMRELGSDARNNLVYACLTATLNIAEVCIILSNKILRGNRAKKYHESLSAAFNSPLFPPLGELGRPIRLFDWREKRHKKKLICKAAFNSNISVFKLFPGFNPSHIDMAIEGGTEGIVIEGFGGGNVPFLENSVLPFIEKACSKKIPVIIATQMEKGVANPKSYEAGLKALKMGAISAGDMTFPACVAKLMWVLANCKTYKERLKKFQKNLAGETGNQQKS